MGAGEGATAALGGCTAIGVGDGDAAALGVCTTVGWAKGMQEVSPRDITVQATPKVKRDGGPDVRWMLRLGFEKDLTTGSDLVYLSLGLVCE